MEENFLVHRAGAKLVLGWVTTYEVLAQGITRWYQSLILIESMKKSFTPRGGDTL